jgi:hypothetical protein
MRHQILDHLRHPVLYLALGVLIGAGGSYAIAATTSKTIKVCADRGTGLLHLKMRGSCKRGQSRVSWNQQGPAGPQGKTGASGPAGQSAPSAWATITNNGTPFVTGTNGISATRVSQGTYQITVTAPACAGKQNVPVATVNDGNPPGGQTAGAFAVAWVALNGIGPSFMVYTGDVVSGTFTPSDHTFFVQDVCGS